MDIREFADELPAAVIERLTEVGIDSARAALELGTEEFARRTGMTPAESDAVLRVIRAEFDEE